ncbi:MAG: protein-L-isoaspartate(D-aspartate) O-methyltransferase [Desulfurivibrio sp.]|nr:MAG: protein-L-isoaspartate(D-aspartate) O-methyltransferase [Desulfurivibrio sp.]
MVEEQIEALGVRDRLTLQAMRAVPRHLYVPGDFREHAYADGPLPIGYGQTISQPYIVAFMTETIRPQSDFRVLEIGTGSGYQAAVLAEIVAEVLTIEIVPELARSAASRLKEQGYANVQTRLGDGFDGWPEKAPFDAIVVTAAAEFIPPPLLDQLKEGGRMIIPVGSPFFLQTLVLVEKREGKITTQSLLPVRFVPLLRGEANGKKKDE